MLSIIDTTDNQGVLLNSVNFKTAFRRKWGEERERVEIKI